MMTEAINAPNLFYPFGSVHERKLKDNERYPNLTESDVTLRDLDDSVSADIGLDLILDALEFKQDDYARGRSISSFMLDDERTRKYRQDLCEELFESDTLRESLQEYKERLDKTKKLERVFDGHRWSGHKEGTRLEKGIRLLRAYVDLINNPPNLEEVTSEGLRDLHIYLAEIKGSDDFKDILGLVGTLNNISGVHFSVALADDGKPLAVSPFEIIHKPERKLKDVERTSPLWRKVMRRRVGYGSQKGHEEGVLKGDGQNWQERSYLSTLISEFLDDQFGDVILEYAVQTRNITKLAGDLEFYTKITAYFADLRKRGIPVCKPRVLPKEERRTSVVNAMNPLVTEGVVGNDIQYNPKQNIFLITGPNNGGKTTYIKTVGLVQILAQNGLLVPAETATVSCVDKVYTHFVAPDDITKGEGRYKNELARMRAFFESATPYSLFVVDEPCGGTSPEAGSEQSSVLLNGFHKLGSTVYFTTHLHPLTDEIEHLPAACNRSVGLTPDKEPTYKIQEGPSNSSYGELIAKEVGLRPGDISSIISERAGQQGFTKLLRT